MTEQAPRKGRHKVNLRRQLVSVPVWWAMVVLCSSMVVLVIAGIGYTSYVDGQRERDEREADRRWCLLLTTLNQAYTSTPPQTDVGRQVAAAVRNLTLQLGCPER